MRLFDSRAPIGLNSIPSDGADHQGLWGAAYRRPKRCDRAGSLDRLLNRLVTKLHALCSCREVVGGARFFEAFFGLSTAAGSRSTAATAGDAGARARLTTGGVNGMGDGSVARAAEATNAAAR